MKVQFLKLILVSVLYIGLLGACSSPTQSSNKDLSTDNSLIKLKQQLRQVRDKMDQTISEKDTDFREQAREILTDFNSKIRDFEGQAQSKDVKVDKKVQKSLDVMKLQSRELQVQLDSASDKTGEKWTQIKLGIKNDLHNLSDSINEFFNIKV